jgi:glutamate carboxypeptidase
MDTVYGPQHPFQKCVMQDDGRLNGPGVADAKGGLVVMLYALQVLEQSAAASKIGWEVIINPDEEFGSPASNNFLRKRAREADWGMLFEPTLPDGTLVSWRKGVGNFVFVVHGVSAHSGRAFENGRNAIVTLCRLLNSIHELNIDPEVTYNVGRVEGGGPLNMVPNLAIGRVNVRVKTVAQEKVVLENFERIKAGVESQDGISVDMHGSFTSPPKELDIRSQQLQSRIERCGNELGLEIKWRGTGGASDGNKFSAAGLPNIDTFGPRGGDIHSSDEYLIVESLAERAKLAALVLLDIAESA